MKNYFYTDPLELAGAFRKLIFKEDCLKGKSTLAEAYGSIMMLNHLGVYQDDEVEKDLVDRLRSNFEDHQDIADAGQSEICYVVTELLNTGGHSKLLMSYARVLGKGDLFVLRKFEPGSLRDPDLFDSVVHENVEARDLVVRLSKYRKVVLLVHPNDIIAISASAVAKILFGTQIIFVNHADHLFCYGLNIADLVCEVSFFGLELNQTFRKTNSVYVGIPVDLENLDFLLRPVGVKNYHFLSVGANIKYEPYASHSFPAMVDFIMKNNNNVRFTLVGPQFFDFWWMKLRFKYPRRLNLRKRVPYNLYKDLFLDADLYIDSFPMTGGTALPEARSFGVPVTGLLTGCSGYSPTDHLKSDSLSSLCESLSGFLGGSGALHEANNSTTFLHEMMEFHSFKCFELRLQNMNLVEDVQIPDFSKSVNIDYFEKLWKKKSRFDFNIKNIFQALILPNLCFTERSRIYFSFFVNTNSMRGKIKVILLGKFLLEFYTKKFLSTAIEKLY